MVIESSATYPGQFRDYMLKITRFTLGQLQGYGEQPLTPEDRDTALHVLAYAIKFRKTWTLAHQILLVLGPKLEQEGIRDEWIPFLEQGIVQCQELGDNATKGNLHFQLGLIYQLCNQLDKAITQFNQSSACFKILDDPVGQARAINRSAYTARLLRNFDEAATLVNRALELLAEDDPERAYSFFVQGVIAYDNSVWEQSAKLFQQSLMLWEAVDNKRMVAWTLSNLGTTMRPMKKYKEAIIYFERAIALLEHIKDPVSQAVARMDLANVYLILQEPQEALSLYNLAEPVLLKAKDERHLAMIYTNIGIAYRCLRQWDRARHSLLASIESWQQIGNIRSLANAVEELGLVYLDQNLYENAITKFHDALNWLSQIKNEPGYARLLESVTAHLAEAHKRKAIEMTN